MTTIKKIKNGWIVSIDLDNKINNFFLRVSNKKNKKYDVYKIENNKLIYIVSFGDNRYEQYYDKLGYYKKLNHYDKDRLYRYYIRNGHHNNDVNSAKYWSNNFLW